MITPRTTSRLIVGTLLLASLAGCLGAFPAPPATALAPTFDPIAFFEGRTRGEGTLDVRGRAGRPLRVEGRGARQPDGSFRLDQTITFGDGKVEERVWLMSRLDSTHFRATLSDAKGEVTAESNGSVFHLRYLLRQPRVYMEQWLYLQPDGLSVANRAQVTVLGIPWARLAETITRVDGVAR